MCFYLLSFYHCHSQTFILGHGFPFLHSTGRAFSFEFTKRRLCSVHLCKISLCPLCSSPALQSSWQWAPSISTWRCLEEWILTPEKMAETCCSWVCCLKQRSLRFSISWITSLNCSGELLQPSQSVSPQQKAGRALGTTCFVLPLPSFGDAGFPAGPVFVRRYLGGHFASLCGHLFLLLEKASLLICEWEQWLSGILLKMLYMWCSILCSCFLQVLFSPFLERRQTSQSPRWSLFCFCVAVTLFFAVVLPLPNKWAKCICTAVWKSLPVSCPSNFLWSTDTSYCSFLFLSTARLFTWIPYGLGSLSSWV